jgi:DNA uptake protein ComE-like DNA-binding protein
MNIKTLFFKNFNDCVDSINKFSDANTFLTKMFDNFVKKYTQRISSTGCIMVGQRFDDMKKDIFIDDMDSFFFIELTHRNIYKRIHEWENRKMHSYYVSKDATFLEKMLHFIFGSIQQKRDGIDKIEKEWFVFNGLLWNDVINICKCANDFVNCAITENYVTTPKIDINTASIEELKTLPKISNALATKIVNYRNEIPFSKHTNINNISGISNGILNACIELIVFTDSNSVEFSYDFSTKVSELTNIVRHKHPSKKTTKKNSNKPTKKPTKTPTKTPTKLIPTITQNNENNITNYIIVNVNTDNLSVFLNSGIPHIQKKNLAMLIIKNRPYYTITDLKKVRGIGDIVCNKISSRISF